MIFWFNRRIKYNRGIPTTDHACSECGALPSKVLVKQLVGWNAFWHPYKFFGTSGIHYWLCAECVGLKEGVREIPEDLKFISGLIIYIGGFLVVGTLLTMCIGSMDVPFRFQ